MAFFVGAGTISDDVVRKETRNGVLAVFRLETGAPNNRKLWIDVEAWGQLAGTVAHHATQGRGVLVSGRLTYKTWRDRDSAESRSRLVVTALDVDFCTTNVDRAHLPASIVASGHVETVYPDRATRNGTVHSFRLAAGRAGTKTGRLWIDVEHWIRHGSELHSTYSRQDITVLGKLSQRASRSSDNHRGPGNLYVTSNPAIWAG